MLALFAQRICASPPSPTGQGLSDPRERGMDAPGRKAPQKIDGRRLHPGLLFRTPPGKFRLGLMKEETCSCGASAEKERRGEEAAATEVLPR